MENFLKNTTCGFTSANLVTAARSQELQRICENVDVNLKRCNIQR